MPMPLRVEFHPEALEEAQAACRWYAERSRAAADAFVDELVSAVQAIQQTPERWPQHVRGTRRYLLKRFPFLIIYRCLADRIEVIAVAHGRRRPGYWKERS